MVGLISHCSEISRLVYQSESEHRRTQPWTAAPLVEKKGMFAHVSECAHLHTLIPVSKLGPAALIIAKLGPAALFALHGQTAHWDSTQSRVGP